MPKYKYKIVGEGGKEIEGIGQAEDKLTLARRLREEGKQLLTATEISENGWSMDRINAFLSRVSLREKILFARNLATMITAGLPLTRALSIFIKQTKNPQLLLVLRQVSDDINKGTSLSEAMGKHEKVFPSLMVSMVHAGEESGKLAESLNLVGIQMEKSYTITKKVKGALMYPGIVFCVMIVVAVLMMIYVVPGLAAGFKEAKVEMPPLTKAFIAISDFLQTQFLASLAIVLVFVGVLVAIAKTKRGSRVIDFVVVRLPVFGKLIREYNSALTTRTLSSLISSGVDIVRSIEITEQVVTNVYYREAMNVAKINVQKGVPLSSVFIEQNKIFPIMVGDMMEVGEETGKLSDMLYKVASFYEEEVDMATGDMAKLIEPLMMVMIAAGVGVFAMAMIAPMYTLMSAM